jgi:taurine transport system permease protein
MSKDQSEKPGGYKPAGDFKYIALGVSSILFFLFIWQIAVMYNWVSSRMLSAPTTVFATLIDKLTSPNPDGATIFVNIAVSLKVSLTGFLTAIVVGTPLGLFMGWYKPVDRFVRPLFEIIRPIPPIAWIPLTILWIGIGLGAKAMIIFFSAFVPCVINSYTGIKSTSPVLISVAKTFGATNFQIFRKVGVPSAMPMAFAGIRIALGNSWGTLVAAELLAANAGLGYMISMGRQFARPDIIILGMITIGVLGYLFTWIFTKVENIVVRWRTM